MSSFVFKDKYYPNLNVFCKNIGFNYFHFRYYYNKFNKNIKDAIDYYLQIKISPKHPIIVDGILYNSVIDFCNKNNIKENTLYKQLKRYNLPINGVTISKYLKGKYNQQIKHIPKFEKLGITNRKEMAKILSFLRSKSLDISEKNIKTYLTGTMQYNPKYGQYKRFTTYKIKGKNFRSIRDICKYFSISNPALLSYMKRHNLQVTNNTINDYINKAKKYSLFIFNGISYKSKTDFLKKNKISYKIFYNFLKSNSLIFNDESVKLFLKRGVKV